MANIRKRFNRLKQEGKKVFIPYLTYGFPDKKTFERIVLAVAECGVDFIEIGMPFSDPIADGAVIQASSKAALDKGANLERLLMALKNLKNKIDAPFILMTYYNPIFYMGLERFCRRASGIISGLVVPDLLAEEASELITLAKRYKIDTVFFIAPTTEPKRFRLIERYSTGFIYYVSVTGTTGRRKQFKKEIFKKIAAAKRAVKAPVCVGFGISTPKQVKSFNKVADGVIVGSAIIRFIKDNYKRKHFLKRLKSFLKQLGEA